METAKKILSMLNPVSEAQTEGLDPKLVEQCERTYQKLQSELKYVNEFLDSAKPDTAASDDELKKSLAEAKHLLDVVTGLRHLSS